MNRTSEIDKLQRKIKVLNESVWGGAATWPHVTTWLSQFSDGTNGGEDEQLHALYLLTHFTRFGETEVRALLRSLYRDHFRHRFISSIRESMSDTLNLKAIAEEFEKVLLRTRFVLVGNPSESSGHLMYYFRQENRLPKTLFSTPFDLFAWISTDNGVQAAIADPNVDTYVFIDDLCGSGQQLEEYSKSVVSPLRQLNPDASFHYYSLFGGVDGLKNIRALGRFDVVETVVELDHTFQCFSDTSRIYANAPEPFTMDAARALAKKYGDYLLPTSPLGYKDGQLLLGFSHNVPDNTLPIIWYDEGDRDWFPLFRRYPKEVVQSA